MGIASEGEIERMRREDRLRLPKRVSTIAALAVIAPVADHCRPNRIEFDVSLTEKEVGLGLDKG